MFKRVLAAYLVLTVLTNSIAPRFFFVVVVRGKMPAITTTNHIRFPYSMMLLAAEPRLGCYQLSSQPTRPADRSVFCELRLTVGVVVNKIAESLTPSHPILTHLRAEK